jgi:hypothetical protein
MYIQTGAVAHPHSYSTGTAVKRGWDETNRSPPSGAEGKMNGAMPPFLHIFTGCTRGKIFNAAVFKQSLPKFSFPALHFTSDVKA